jgi:hypothetical protein
MSAVRTFSLNEVENYRANRFMNEHKDLHGNDPRIGFSFMFRPTGIGDGVVVGCGGCNKALEVTDFESW